MYASLVALVSVPYVLLSLSLTTRYTARAASQLTAAALVHPVRDAFTVPEANIHSLSRSTQLICSVNVQITYRRVHELDHHPAKRHKRVRMSYNDCHKGCCPDSSRGMRSLETWTPAHVCLGSAVQYSAHVCICVCKLYNTWFLLQVHSEHDLADKSPYKTQTWCAPTVAPRMLNTAVLTCDLIPQCWHNPAQDCNYSLLQAIYKPALQNP